MHDIIPSSDIISSSAVWTNFSELSETQCLISERPQFLGISKKIVDNELENNRLLLIIW